VGVGSSPEHWHGPSSTNGTVAACVHVYIHIYIYIYM
jgi:hypothetical protein